MKLKPGFSRIGIDCRIFGNTSTGVGRYVFELVNNLQDIDTVNSYYLFFSPEAYKSFTPKNPNFHKILTHAKHYSFFEQTVFLNELKAQKLDLMHFTNFNGPIFYNRPSIVTIHDLTLHFFPGKKMTGPLYRLAYMIVIKNIVKKAKRIIAVSQNTATDIKKILKAKKDNIQVIYPGVSDTFSVIKDRASIDNLLEKMKVDRPYLLYTGVWRNHKNLRGLIKAFKLIRTKHNIDLQLVITGNVKNIYAGEIFKEAGELREKGLIIFAGHVSDVDLIKLMNGAKCYVFPSFYEGFGLPPLESMKCGTPVAVSNTSSLPEICGEAATYFDPYDVNNMAEQIVKLVNSPVHFEFMSERGLEQVKKYNWRLMTKQIYSLYLDILIDATKKRFAK